MAKVLRELLHLILLQTNTHLSQTQSDFDGEKAHILLDKMVCSCAMMLLSPLTLTIHLTTAMDGMIAVAGYVNTRN